MCSCVHVHMHANAHERKRKGGISYVTNGRSITNCLQFLVVPCLVTLLCVKIQECVYIYIPVFAVHQYKVWL